MKVVRSASDIWQELDGQADIAHTLGLQFVSEDDATVTFAMNWTPDISQPGGVFAAASLYGLADIASTVAAMRIRPSGFMLAVDSSVHLLTNARGTVHARTRVLRAGRRSCVVTADLVGEGERQLAVVTTTFLPEQPQSDDTGPCGPTRRAD